MGSLMHLAPAGHARPFGGARAELEIASRLDQVGPAAAWLGRLAQGLDLPEETRYRLDLGLTEALTNVIAYAFPDGAEHPIRIRLHADGAAVALEVEDEGRPFDPLRTAPRPRPLSLDDAPIGGLGIHLMRTLLDECRYRRDAGKNRLTLVARPAAGTSPAP